MYLFCNYNKSHQQNMVLFVNPVLSNLLNNFQKNVNVIVIIVYWTTVQFFFFFFFFLEGCYYNPTCATFRYFWINFKNINLTYTVCLQLWYVYLMTIKIFIWCCLFNFWNGQHSRYLPDHLSKWFGIIQKYSKLHTLIHKK